MQTAAHHPSLDGLSKAHADIIAHLFHLSALGNASPRDAQACDMARQAIAFFKNTVLSHHHTEEQRLFPMVRAAASPGAEREYVDTLVHKLTDEHRKIETLWNALEGMLNAMLNGQTDPAMDAHIQNLVLDYGDHATEEESKFLPLCHEILRRGNPQFNESELLHAHFPAAA